MVKKQVDKEITLSNLNLVLASDKRKHIAHLMQKRAKQHTADEMRVLRE
jgi:hypothetical protein